MADQTVGNMPTYICQIIKLIPDGPNDGPNFDKFFIWKKLAEQTNWQYIKLILNLQAFLIFFKGVEMSKLSFSLIISAFLFQINK